MKHEDIEEQGVIEISGASPATPAANTLYKDNIVNAWIYYSSIGATTINNSFNVLSLTDVGVGSMSVNFDLDFANVNYAVVGSSGEFHMAFGGPAVGAITAVSANSSHASVDTDRNWVLAMGDQ